MPVVTTAEKPLTLLLVSRFPEPAPAIFGRAWRSVRIWPVPIASSVHPCGRCPQRQPSAHTASPRRRSAGCESSFPAANWPAFISKAQTGLPTSPTRHPARTSPCDTVTQQLDEYFRGVRTRFDLPLRLEGTPFQVAVWSALLEIPYGQTWSYSELAAWIGHPRAARAVGAANGQNPISIVIPCHRLIGRDGDLTGYGGGLDRKRSLLDLESANPIPRRPAVRCGRRSGG